MPYSPLKILLVFLSISALSKAQTPSFQRVTLPAEVRSINCILKQDDKTMVLATNKGLVFVQNSIPKLVYDDKNPGLYKINKIIKDNSGNYWYGTYQNSVVHYRNGAVKEYSFSDLTEKTEIILGMNLQAAVLWFSTSEGNIFKLQIQSGKITKIESPTKTEVYSIQLESDGKMWIASNEGVFSKSGTAPWVPQNTFFQAFSMKQKDNEYWTIGRDKEYHVKLMYLYSYKTDLLKIRKQKWGDLIFNNLPTPYLKLNALDIDSEGMIWLASSEGIFKYDPYTAFSTWYSNNKYPEFEITNIQDIAVMNENEVWVTDGANLLIRITLTAE